MITGEAAPRDTDPRVTGYTMINYDYAGHFAYDRSPPEVQILYLPHYLPRTCAYIYSRVGTHGQEDARVVRFSAARRRRRCGGGRHHPPVYRRRDSAKPASYRNRIDKSHRHGRAVTKRPSRFPPHPPSWSTEACVHRLLIIRDILRARFPMVSRSLTSVSIIPAHIHGAARAVNPRVARRQRPTAPAARAVRSFGLG